jgi:SAM-dependent methyltransferase
MTDLASDSPPRAGGDRVAASELNGLVKLYGARCVPLVYDPFLWLGERKVMAGLRREVVGRADGRVLEVGAGTGLNIPHYRAGVGELVLTEPEPAMAQRLQRRAKRAQVPARVLTAFAERLPFENASLDNVVVTLVLCTVAEPTAALQEARRVLVDGAGYSSSSTSGPTRGLRSRHSLVALRSRAKADRQSDPSTAPPLLAYCETGLMSVDASRRTAQRNAGMRSRVHAFRQRLGSRPLPDPPRQAGETHVDAPLAAGRSDTGRPPGESAPSTPMLEESRNLRAASTGKSR